MAPLFKTTLLIVVFSIAIRFFGFIREMVFAAYYGTSSAMDAFVVASEVPSMFVGIAVTSIMTAFIPLYTEYKIKDEFHGANNFVQAVTTIVMILTASIGALGWFFAPQIVLFLAPGFTVATQQLAAGLMRIMMPTIFFSGLLGVGSALQQANNQFFYYVVSQLPLSVITIVAIVCFAPQYGIYAAGVAILIAAAVQVLVLLPGMPSCGHHRFEWSFDFRQPAIRKMGRFVIPVIIGIVFIEINSIVTRILASSLPPGSISALNYAIRINLVFPFLFVYPITTVVFPVLAQQFAQGNIDDFRRYVNMIIRIIAFIIVPTSMIVAKFPNPIIRALFERGAFGSKSTDQTAAVIIFFIVGLLGVCLMEFLSKAFFARKNTRKPLIATTLVVLLNIAFSLFLVKKMDAAGLALAASIATNIGVILLLHYMSKELGGLGVRTIMLSLVKVILCCIPTVLLSSMAYGTSTLILSHEMNHGYLQNLMSLISALLVGFSTYVLTAYLLKSEELYIISEPILRKVFKVNSKRFQGWGN